MVGCLRERRQLGLRLSRRFEHVRRPEWLMQTEQVGKRQMRSERQ